MGWVLRSAEIEILTLLTEQFKNNLGKRITRPRIPKYVGYV